MEPIRLHNVRVLDCLGAAPFAGCVLVDGDPLANVALLRERDCIALVMKGGKICAGAGVPH